MNTINSSDQVPEFRRTKKQHKAKLAPHKQKLPVMSSLVRFFVLASLLFSQVLYSRPLYVAEASGGVVLVEKDFSKELPAELHSKKTQPRSHKISITDGAKFDVIIHYDQLVDPARYFRKVRVELPGPVPGIKVDAGFLSLVNLGTIEKPIMAVPLMIVWSGKSLTGTWGKSASWMVYGDGRLEKSK